MPVIAGGLVAILGAAAFAGWAINLPLVTTIMTGGYPIFPLMALCFVLAAIALIMAVVGVGLQLWMRFSKRSPRSSPRSRGSPSTSICGAAIGFDLLLFGTEVGQTSNYSAWPNCY